MNRFEESEGHLFYHLTCPVCGKSDIILYSKRKPLYCSDACKQKAYRMRKAKRNNEGVTKLKDRLTRRFGESAGYRLSLIYQAHGHQVGAECERAMAEAMQHAREVFSTRR
jgi:hypothetical protein